MIDEALDLGRTHVLIGVENASGAFIPGRFNEIITSIDVTMLNSRWKVFHVDENYPGHFDYKATFKITGLDVSPEREYIERYTDEKEVKDGWRYVLDENGNVAKDTLGNDIKEDNWVIVRANVVEIHREKGAIVRGQLEYTNTLTGDVIRSIPVNVESVFEDYASTFNGDRRALCDRSRRRLKDRPLPFPPDHAMIIEASEELKAILADKLSRTHI